MRLILAIAMLLLSVPAWAHKPSDSLLSLTVQHDRIEGRWDIALRDLDDAIGLDADGDGAITWGEVRSTHDKLPRTRSHASPSHQVRQAALLKRLAT